MNNLKNHWPFVLLVMAVAATVLIVSRSVMSGMAIQEVTAYADSIAAISILGTALAAFLAYRQTVAATRNRTTYEQIARQVSDRDVLIFVDASRNIREIYEKPISYSELVEDHKAKVKLRIKKLKAAEELRVNGGPFDRTDYENVLSLLNYYESLAVGIESGALSEEMVKVWWRTTYVRDFGDYKHFIRDARMVEGANPSAFTEYEKFADKWAETEEEYELIKMPD